MKGDKSVYQMAHELASSAKYFGTSIQFSINTVMTYRKQAKKQYIQDVVEAYAKYNEDKFKTLISDLKQAIKSGRKSAIWICYEMHEKMEFKGTDKQAQEWDKLVSKANDILYS